MRPPRRSDERGIVIARSARRSPGPATRDPGDEAISGIPDDVVASASAAISGIPESATAPLSAPRDDNDRPPLLSGQRRPRRDAARPVAAPHARRGDLREQPLSRRHRDLD